MIYKEFRDQNEVCILYLLV